MKDFSCKQQAAIYGNCTANTKLISVIDSLKVSSNYHVIVHETPGNPCFPLLKGMATTGYMQGSLKCLTEGTEYLECDVMGNIFIEAII